MQVDHDSEESVAAAETYVRAGATCQGCAIYHGLWPYLRLAGITRSHLDLGVVLSHIRTGVARGARRILIAGAADALTTAAVLRELPADNSTMLEVVDRCATPLETIRRALPPEERRVLLRQADLLDDPGPEAVDVALAHGLLGFFSDDDQVAVLRAIGRRLQVDARLIVAERVGTELARDADSIRQHAERIIRRLGDAGVSLPVPAPDFLAVLLQDGQRRLRMRGRFADEAALAARLTAAGLVIRDMVDIDRDPGSGIDPMQRSAGRRVIIVASPIAVVT